MPVNTRTRTKTEQLPSTSTSINEELGIIQETDMVFTKMSGVLMMVLMIVVTITTTRVAEGQSNTPSCASKLVPCANYLNSTSPPPTCCNPLKEAVTKELTCLCNLYNTPGFLAGIGINITQALKLTGYCGIPGDLSACKAQAPGSSSEPPPAVPGGKDDNGVGKIAGVGFSSLLLLLASVMLC